MLATCHDELGQLLRVPLESLQAAQCVERHRLDWRPDVVHTVLLAESHVYTDDSELQTMSGPHDIAVRPLNQTFARFVYCLGYGEPEFAGPNLPAKGGTPQYWKLFASCVAGPSDESFFPILKGRNPQFVSRIRAKLTLLEQLRSLGVWLIDASAVALYSPGGLRLHQRDYEKVLKCCWDHYTGALVRQAQPHSIVVIGKGVANAMSRELHALTNVETHCVSQPQGCRKHGAIDSVYAKLFEVCQTAARERGVIITESVAQLG